MKKILTASSLNHHCIIKGQWSCRRHPQLTKILSFKKVLLIEVLLSFLSFVYVLSFLPFQYDQFSASIHNGPEDDLSAMPCISI